VNHVPFVPAWDLPEGEKRLLALAAILDTADARHAAKREPKYRQTKFAHTCGTPACAGGHWTQHSSGRLELIDTDGFGSFRIRDQTGAVRTVDAFRPEFSLSHQESVELFGADGCDYARTAKEAAEYIRRFVRRRVLRRELLGENPWMAA
jgi:hypothetical protein